MKHWKAIWILFSAGILVACHHPVVKMVSPQQQKLAAIDSMMWKRPDSAFAMLQDFADSPMADSLNTFEGHYCQLLISELLYKNYNRQSNRENLLNAVNYFDSLMVTNGQDVGIYGVSERERNAFLDARAHYINGVGFYELANVVNACAEYINALEIMDEHFGEKELTGEKAAFMFYTYNRLMELFSAQFMMDPAIFCGKQAWVYCQMDTSLSKEIPIIIFHIGKQYDKKGENNTAKAYYGLAIEGCSDTNSLVYRDAVSMKAICDYQMGLGTEQSLNTLKRTLFNAKGEKEKMSRFLAIGAIFMEEGAYDSAVRYFEPVFYNETEVTVKIRIAESLRVIYDSIKNQEKLNECMRFLVEQKKPEGENKAFISRLEDMYQNYLVQKKEKQAVAERGKAVKRTMVITIPIAVVMALSFFVWARVKNKRLLNKQQVEAEKMLEEREVRHAKAIEAERWTHHMEQAAIAGRLKRSNQEVREMKDQIRQQNDMFVMSDHATSFNEEPICRLIMRRVHDGQFKSKINCEIYRQYALNKQQLVDLRVAADHHFSQFTLRLRKAYPKLTNIDIDYCCLYLLNLTHADVSALMQRAYNTVVERSSKIQKVFGGEKPLPVILMDVAQDSSSI